MDRTAWLVGAMCEVGSSERQAPRVWLDSGVVAVLQRRARRDRDETGALGVQGGEGITAWARQSSAGRLDVRSARGLVRTVYVVYEARYMGGS
jgi:hypothetical protein